MYTSGADSTYVDEEPGRRRTFRRALEDFDCESGRLLDIGCNTGVFMEEARAAGFQVFGVEPSRFAVERAVNDKGLDVHCGAVPCDLPWRERFDVISMWDVIEHVDDPLGLLTFLHSKLSDGGELHLSTMDVESVYARLAGRRWPWYMRMHIQYFSRRSLEKILLKAGFRRVKIIRYRHIVHENYLAKKLEHLSLPLRLIGAVGRRVCRDADGYVTVDMRDMMHAIAWR